MAALSSMQATTAFAGTATVPNTFTPGTAAKAADVNANFTAVAAGVNGNAQDIATLKTDVQTLKAAAPTGVMVNVSGTSVGVLLSIPNSSGTPGLSAGGNVTWALNIMGFIIPVSTGVYPSQTPNCPSCYVGRVEGSILPPAFVFDQANCVGNRYVMDYRYNDWYFARQGVVFGAASPTDVSSLYMIKGTSSVVTPVSVQFPVINLAGALQAPKCLTVVINPTAAVDPNTQYGYFSQGGLIFFSATANDPTVTGVSGNLVGPVTLSVQ